MVYTPEPIPTSMVPALILAAMTAQASRPEEQSLLMAKSGVVSGIPATICAILMWKVPEPTIKLFPTQMS